MKYIPIIPMYHDCLMNRLNRAKGEKDEVAKTSCMIDVMRFIVETEDFAIRWYDELKQLLPQYAEVIDEIRNDEVDHKHKDEKILGDLEALLAQQLAKRVPHGKAEYKWIRVLEPTEAVTSSQDFKVYGPYCTGTEVKVPNIIADDLVKQKKAKWLQ